MELIQGLEQDVENLRHVSKEVSANLYGLICLKGIDSHNEE